jgi:hypothetical protein
MPEAMANGLLASSPTIREPRQAEIQEARKIPFHRGVFTAKLERMLGLMLIMYTMETKVVTPARISVLTLVPLSRSLKNLSNGILFPWRQTTAANSVWIKKTILTGYAQESHQAILKR